jgi:hypothetical protein
MERSKKLKAFISYAHADYYAETFIEELKKHSSEWDIWADDQLPLGKSWPKEIQKNIDKCDFAILLVSEDFFNSKYIKEEEFNKFLKRQNESDFLFFPVLLNPCNIKQWKALSEKQFFMPRGKKYGRSDMPNITYADLVKLDKNDTPIGNPYRSRYMVDLVASLEKSVLENQKKKQIP